MGSRNRPFGARWLTAFLVVAVSLAELLADDGKRRPAPAASRATGTPADSARTHSKDPQATVLIPDGLPAAKAKVVLAVEESCILTFDGENFENFTDHVHRETDAAGRFSFPPLAGNACLVVTHRAGFAEVRFSDASFPKMIRLTPWARVEGTYRVARRLRPNVKIVVSPNSMFGARNGEPKISVACDAITDTNGRFAFPRVPPGRARIGRVLKFPGDFGAREPTSAQSVPITLAAGKSTQVSLGGSGWPVIGKLRRPIDSSEQISWESALIEASPDVPEARASGLTFSSTVDRDGNFSLDDIPPGKYRLVAYFAQRPGLRSHEHLFVVPTTKEELSERPVDLGVLELKPQAGPGGFR